METDQITDITNTIKQQFNEFAKKYSVDNMQINFRLTINSGFPKSINSNVFGGNRFLTEASIKDIFNIESFKMLVVTPRLVNKLSELAKKNGLNPDFAEARIYTETPDCTPLIDLYSNNTKICNISIEQLLN